MRETRLIHMWDVTEIHICMHDRNSCHCLSKYYGTRLIHTCDVTHSYVGKKKIHICAHERKLFSLVYYGTRLIHTCDVTHSYVGLDSSYVGGGKKIYICAHDRKCCHCLPKYYGTRLIHTWDVTHSYVGGKKYIYIFVHTTGNVVICT